MIREAVSHRRTKNLHDHEADRDPKGEGEQEDDRQSHSPRQALPCPRGAAPGKRWAQVEQRRGFHHGRVIMHADSLSLGYLVFPDPAPSPQSVKINRT
jgi:hypothetical protein